MYETFYNAPVFNGNIGDWDTSKVTTMRGFLLGATSFNADLFKWNVSNVRDWDEAFQDTPALTNCREVSNCDKSALNESVRLKACDNEVTLDVFHFDISALKAIASLANILIVVTLATFHREISELKARVSEKVWYKVSKRDVFQRDKSELNPCAPANVAPKSVTTSTFHFEISVLNI